MANITRMNVMITGNAKGLGTSLSKAEGLVAGFSAKMNRHLAGSNARISQFASNLGGIGLTATKRFAQGALAASAAMAYLSKQTIDSIGDTSDFAKRLGIGYNSLKKFQLAGKLAGIGAEQMNGALEKLGDTIGSALGGNGSAVKAFEGIGISMQDLEHMRPEDRFEAIADALSRIPDPARKLAAARDIFGKQGGALVGLFDDAGESLSRANARLMNFGIALSSLDQSKVEGAGDAIDVMGLALEGVATRIAVQVSPYISLAAKDTEAWIEKMGGVGPAMDSAFDGTLGKMDQVLTKMDKIDSAWQGFIGGVQEFLGDKLQKVDEFAKRGTYAAPIAAAERERELERRAQMVPEHRREEFKARARAQGGFGVVNPFDPGVLAEGFKGAAEERAGLSATAIGERSSVSAFRDWRLRAESNAMAAEGIQLTPPVQYKKHVDNGYLDKIPQGIPDYISKMTPGSDLSNNGPVAGGEVVNLLRGIYQNTGKNAVGFAG